MKIRIGQHIGGPDIEAYGFSFDSVEPDGTKKYTDGFNTIWESRIEETIVNIYSHGAGTTVKELAVELDPEWGRFSLSEEDKRARRERVEKMKAAWHELELSLPAPDEQSEELRAAVEIAKERTEYAAFDPWEDPEENYSSLADAHEAVHKVKNIYPATKISPILILIVEIDTATAR